MVYKDANRGMLGQYDFRQHSDLVAYAMIVGPELSVCTCAFGIFVSELILKPC